MALLDQRVSYGIASYDNQAVQQADLSMLLSTGVQCVRVDIDYAPWLANDTATIALVDSVVSSIRAAGNCLILGDAGSESYQGAGAIPWSQFKQAWVQRVATLAARYHPDYYLVVKDPSWYEPMVSDAHSNPGFLSAADWVPLIQNLTNAVLAVSPTTKVGVSIDATSLNGAAATTYVTALNGVQKFVSFIGFNIYNTAGRDATLRYLSQHPPSKDVWIAAAWSSPSPSTAASAQSDALWLNSTYQFAQQIGARFLIPFFTDQLASYSFDTNSSDIVAAYSQRTPIYQAFVSLPEG
jgi:hypothetical protein